ncbi:MAG: FeoB-associated Cys-rich membrane protein [Pedobacter sp.]|nr:MAG: FeoB-associated Cys-rich membrane protein [Pedobacter sp.]
MDIQTIILFVLFAAALWYIGRMIYRSITPGKDGCGSNCKCGVDFSTIEPKQK